MNRSKDQMAGENEAARSTYRAPEIVSLSSTDLLELLGPAQGYGSGGGGSTGSGIGDPSKLGFNKG